MVGGDGGGVVSGWCNTVCPGCTHPQSPHISRTEGGKQMEKVEERGRKEVKIYRVVKKGDRKREKRGTNRWRKWIDRGSKEEELEGQKRKKEGDKG